ncbi:MAG: hypothetical protein ABJE66_03125 [Deltaproteobacteria bacterium]
MRLALLALALTSGCSLYFAGDHPSPPTEDDDAPPVILIDGGVSSLEYFCEGTTIYETVDGTRTHANPVSSCPYGCEFTTFYQSGSPCLEAPPPVYSCTDSGACSANATDSCAAPLQCALVVSAGACTCNAGTWSCQDACNQGLCGAAEVQAAIAGDWTGTVTPPSFAQPYQIKLHIGPNGLWSATTTGDVAVAFYYGDNGGNLGSRIVIQAQTTVGAYASVGLFSGEVQGLFTGLTVDPHHMKFAFVDSWLSCGRTFYFDLTR